MHDLKNASPIGGNFINSRIMLYNTTHKKNAELRERAIMAQYKNFVIT
jgi:hypothetical protein